MRFDLQRFSADVKEYRLKERLTQREFAEQLGLENHTLVSLYESGKRAPSKETLANYCRVTGHAIDEYWVESVELPIAAYLMGNISGSDRDSFESALKKIGIREYLFAVYDRVCR